MIERYACCFDRVRGDISIIPREGADGGWVIYPAPGESTDFMLYETPLCGGEEMLVGRYNTLKQALHETLKLT
jgi:hypothetical protein